MEKTKRFTLNAVTYIFLTVIGLIVVLPLLYAFFGSLKENMELMTGNNILPQKITFDNYVYAWKNVHFVQYTKNSLIMSVGVVIGTVVVSTMAGYVFSRLKDLPFLNIIKGVYLASIFISLGPTTLYPVFKLLTGLRLNNTYFGLIISHVGAQVVNIVLVEGYLNGIPRELDEAASIDGCGFFNTFVRIILPLIRPVIAIIALLAFKHAWNSYLLPSVLTMGNPDMQPLSVAIVALKSDGKMATMWSVILAGANISLIPMIVVYCICNKQFISGLTVGGVKG